jgi:hypothetical protein
MDLFKDHDMTIANAAPNPMPENVIELFIFNKPLLIYFGGSDRDRTYNNSVMSREL